MIWKTKNILEPDHRGTTSKALCPFKSLSGSLKSTSMQIIFIHKANKSCVHIGMFEFVVSLKRLNAALPDCIIYSRAVIAYSYCEALWSSPRATGRFSPVCLHKPEFCISMKEIVTPELILLWCRSSMCLFTMPSWKHVCVETQPYQCVSSEPFTTTSAGWTHRPTPARSKMSSR